jgi:asparagine synthase (glutamine-hydrolysing)
MFSSKTDTEVVAHLYEELGEQCFEKLEGMFAVAIWDQPRKKLFLARDRFGEKPLYYFEDCGSIAFASELRAFGHCSFFTNELNWAALDQFLTLGYILAPCSPFRRTQKLLPGHYLVFDQATGEYKTKQYWSPPDCEEPKARKSDAEYIDEFMSLLTESVKSRMVSDVPVGAFLSGGIDSSLVVAAMAQLKMGPVRTFSIGLRASSTHNENPFAEQVADTLRVEHSTLLVNLDEVLGIIEKLPELFDEPLGDVNLITVYLITKLAKSKGITVMLSGDGGDEVLLGYPIYRQIEILETIHGLPRLLRSATASGVEIASRLVGNSKLAKAACVIGQDDFGQASYNLTSYGAWSVDELRKLKAQPDLTVDNESFLAAFESSGGRQRARDRARMALLLTYLPDNNLARMDRASMANSVETRAPFLHPMLSDFAAGLPRDMQIRGSILKYLLRHALSQFVSSEIAQRPKQGFNAIPMADWMRKELTNLIYEYLNPTTLKQQGIFSGEEVTRTLDEHGRRGRFNHWRKLWLLLVLQMWLRRHARPCSGQSCAIERGVVIPPKAVWAGTI